MTIAFDKATSLGESSGGLSATHSPTGTPKSVLVMIAQASVSDAVTGVTYGGVAMTRVDFLTYSDAESLGCYIYHLGENVPTGSQSVVVSTTGSVTKWGQCLTFTCSEGSGTLAVRSGRSNGTISNPSITLELPSTRPVYGVGILSSGQNADTSISAGTGETDVAEHDFGVTTASIIRATSQSGGGNVTINWTVGSDEQCALAVALEEVEAISGNVTLGGSARSGAKVVVGWAADFSNLANYEFYETVVTDGSGNWTSKKPVSLEAFCFACYDDGGGNQYTAPAHAFVA